MKQTKTFLLRCTLCICLVSFCLTATSCSAISALFNKDKDKGADTSLEASGCPYDSVIDREIVIPDADDAQGQKELALYLYQTANKAFQSCPACAYTVDSKADTNVLNIMNLLVQGCRFCLKTQEEYYYTEYSYTAGDVEKVVTMFSSVEDTLFAYRQYGSIERGSLYVEKSLKPLIDAEEGEFVIESNWAEDNMVAGYPKEEELPSFSSRAEGEYAQTEQNILAETIKSATVTHNDEEGYYEIVIELDVQNPVTTEESQPYLQSGLKNGYYTSITETMQIWDNGYFKEFFSLDVATSGVISLTLDFRTYFYYDTEHLNPEHYVDFVEVKNNAQNKE